MRCDAAFGRATVLAGVFALVAGAAVAQPRPAAETRITILSDAFAERQGVALDWGFAALVEHRGRRILFDTGNNAGRFAANVRALGVDLSQLDFVVISHRHGDHTDGLRHLLTVNPTVTIYVPDDEYFGGPTPAAFFSQPAPSLPSHMRYFGGTLPDPVPHGTPWQGARFVRVGSAREVAPGIRLVANRSKTAAFSETPEVSLVLETAAGPVVVVGCSHPGIEQILGAVDAGATGIRLLAGGMHLVTAPPDEVQRIGEALRTRWKVKAVAPGHCTGETAFAAWMKLYGADYVYAGVGSVLRVGE